MAKQKRKPKATTDPTQDLLDRSLSLLSKEIALIEGKDPTIQLEKADLTKVLEVIKVVVTVRKDERDTEKSLNLTKLSVDELEKLLES